MQLIFLTLLAYSFVEVNGGQTNNADREQENGLFPVAAYTNDDAYSSFVRKPMFEDDWSPEDDDEEMPAVLSSSNSDPDDMSRSLRSHVERDVTGDVSPQCRAVCKHCRKVLSIRWAALCTVQCRYRGQAYNACLIAWNQLRHILMV